MTHASGADTLFTPIRINKTTLRNRIVFPAMVTNFAAVNGEVTEQLIAYHGERSKGGCALNILEATYVHGSGNSYLRGLGIDDDAKIPGLRRLTKAIHLHGGKAAIQLQHGGRTALPASSGGPILLVSSVPGVTPHQSSRVMDHEDILSLVEAYRQAARRAGEAGFDAVELHGAHGYLLAQFMSPYTNRRDDRYGGSFENRMRFPLQVLEAVRAEVGPDYPILFRLSVDEFLPGGIDLALAQDIARSLADHGVDAINVSVGAPETNHYVIPPANIRPGWNAERSQAVREAVEARVPVIVVGRIADRSTAEGILASGRADLVAMGRALIADPCLPAKLFSGMEASVIPCVGCNEGCAGALARGETVRCAVNPRSGYEARYPHVKSATSRRVTVVGGGPAGLQAALTAAHRGHKVILFEQRDRLGGLLNVAARPPHKELYGRLIRYFEQALAQAKVEVRLNAEATPEAIRATAPDALILATGSRPVRPGFAPSGALTAQEVLLGAPAGPRVLIVGGGLVGGETAEFLAERDKTVSLLEIREDIALDMESRTRRFLLPRLRELGVSILTGCELRECKADGRARIRDAFGTEREIGPFDSVVLAVGYRPERGLEAALAERAARYRTAGDCVNPGKVLQAVEQGMRAAYDL